VTAADVPGADSFSLHVEDRREGGRRSVVATLVGELDIYTVSSVRATLDDLLVDGASPVVVDLTGLTFMDSSGLGTLVAAHKKARVLRSALVVVCADGVVLRLLSVTGLIRVLHVAQSVEHAFAEVEAWA
jgi:anti-sigma B factor antagonist